MAVALEGYELIKGCFEVARIIYDLTQDTSFLKDKCEELSEQIEFTMEPMQRLEDVEEMEVNIVSFEQFHHKPTISIKNH